MRKNKTDAKLLSLEHDLLNSYMESVRDLNASMTINDDEQTLETSKSPIDLAFKSGASFMLRMILIKHFGHTKKELDEKEKLEFEGKKV